ncbi:GDP/UDP-N,N'-diacetylbacillosamine 2-epimerase (hydrolysing) [Chitinophaga costaii]|uniref:GDP/UDP-N,N'-diacetylbacillosamine 2-epimerase (Hydrolysing) n=1 Tax=Chitinophaga costaii TaxID=1335309 RepID=A0A1C4F6E1_9BACT|nr:UDP-N-acetylglucosamine 2-epimerase [Chitinophaga costaii]PUZ21238.1 UDP-N-acetylglucosamine 2-epimerase (hydrolyzing) [Chitinophaga costaii]SCC51588.1 GDP/UDP-N,N'-diacetylbacillosamine 2-epimerase (hydrolysing) [Chitinophaga costaii]
MSNKKICVVTGTRAEYGLLYWLMKVLKSTSGFTLQVVATGMHLSPEFGLTYRQIEADGFVIDKKVEMLLSSDTTIGINKSLGLGVIGMSEAFVALEPDLVILLGDRFEIFAAATAAMISRIPIAHCHGGEATEGVIDESIRHSITKMSHLHFTSNEVYRKRVIQLGESPDRVFNVGALGIENINRLKLLDQEQFEHSIGFVLGQKNVLVTFHPVTLEVSSAESQFNALLMALDALQGVKMIFTKANADTDGRIINQLIDDYVSRNREKAIAFTSLGQLRYLSALQYMDVIIGNSSSGILEVPSFKKPTVNIGDRQLGRIKAMSVIDCEPDVVSISSAIRQAFDTGFRQSLQNMESPYGKGNPSEQIVEIIQNTPLNILLKKRFYDL